MTYTPSPSPDNPFHPSKEWIWNCDPPPEVTNQGSTFGQNSQRPKLKKQDPFGFDQQPTHGGHSLFDIPMSQPTGHGRGRTVRMRSPLPPGKTLGYLGQPMKPVHGAYGFGIYKPSDKAKGEVDFFPMGEERWQRAVEQANQISKEEQKPSKRRGSLDLTAPPDLPSRPLMARGASSAGRLETWCQMPTFVPYRPPAAKPAIQDLIDPAWKKEFEKIKAMDLKSLSNSEKMEVLTGKIFYMLQYLVELPGTSPQARKYHKELVDIASRLGMEE